MRFHILFQILLRMSFEGGILAVLVLGMRALFKHRLSPWVYQFLWILVLIRLLVPLSIESDLSIFNTFGRSPAAVTEQIDAPGFQPDNVQATEVILENDYGKASLELPKRETNTTVFSMLQTHWPILIWAIGFILFLCLTSILYYTLHRRIELQGLHADNTLIDTLKQYSMEVKVKQGFLVKLADLPFAPCVFGVLKPKLILPVDFDTNFDKAQRSHILLHELIHIKRRDYLFNFLLLITACIHWFNPVIWFSLSRIQNDIESACDASVLRTQANINPLDYGRTIVNLAKTSERPRLIAIHTGAMGSKETVKQRIKSIALYGKRTRTWLALSILIISIVLVSCMTTTKPYKVNQPATPTANPIPAGMDSFIEDYIHKNASQLYPACDKWIVAFDRAEALTEGNKYTIAGVVLVVGYTKENNTLTMTYGQRHSTVIVLEKKNSSFNVLSYDKPLNSDEYLNESVMKIVKNSSKIKASAYRAKINLIEKGFKSLGNKPFKPIKTQVSGYLLNYQIPYFIDSAERVSRPDTDELLDVGLKFLNGCAKENWDSVKPLCTSELWSDIQTVSDSNKKLMRGGDLAKHFGKDFKHFNGITEPMYNNNEKAYDVMIGYYNGETILTVRLSMKSTSPGHFLVDRIMINP